MVLQDHFDAINKRKEKYMKKISENEMLEIIGGISISAALFSALSKAANTILDAGRALGSSLRRLYSNDLCACK